MRPQDDPRASARSRRVSGRNRSAGSEGATGRRTELKRFETSYSTRLMYYFLLDRRETCHVPQNRGKIPTVLIEMLHAYWLLPKPRNPTPRLSAGATGLNPACVRMRAKADARPVSSAVDRRDNRLTSLPFLATFRPSRRPSHPACAPRRILRFGKRSGDDSGSGPPFDA